MRKIAIFGGAFNPIHYGHLWLAETALDQFDLDALLWVPTYVPPHKPTFELAAFEHRLEMVQRAIADYPHFTAMDLERHQPTPSYASTTFTQLQTLYPHTQWYWVIGQDAFAQLPGWRHSQDLIAHCCWLVAPRLPLDLHEIGQQVTATLVQRSLTLHWHPLPMPAIAISSSLIRQYCQQGRSLRYLVPAAVRSYIHTHQLYQDS